MNEYLFNHLGSVGVSGRIPFIGGGSMRVGISYYQGEWDAGFIMEGDLKATSASKMIGGARLEAAYDTGNFDTQRGNFILGLVRRFGQDASQYRFVCGDGGNALLA